MAIMQRSLLLSTLFLISFCVRIHTSSANQVADDNVPPNIQLGPRPHYLVNDMDPGPLKNELQLCSERQFSKTYFSIGHRGAPLQFPEHSRESYIAAARMGAGILECDVTFTKDLELVCRHSQCDLHTTTDILAHPELAAKCSEPFRPALVDPSTGEMLTKASAKCCTSDLTLKEFKSLCAKMDTSNPEATTAEEFMNGTANWRTGIYAGCGTVLSHRESITLFQQLGVKMTPELKTPSVDMPYLHTFTQQIYAQQLIDEYKERGVPAEQVFVQSFNLEDIRYWISREPQLAKQAIYLDGRYSDRSFDHTSPDTWKPSMEELVTMGVKIIAPPQWVLLTTNAKGKIVASEYAKRAQEAGLQIITWSLERSGSLKGGGGWYYQSVADLINNDGDMFTVLDVLAQEVGVIGVFSDWPATVTYYANCKGL